jgi:crotonobetainyl-CoA:carnitine CoA-transferase CaiB-like acyl-CoA transferase
MKAMERGLLKNILILDLADEQGSFCSKLLADLGAMVIKIESPEGDAARNNPSFYYHNTNKLGVVLDPEKRKRKQSFFRLLEKADVLVETWTPRCIKALNLNHKQLSRINPSLVHVSITGFGHTGPKRAYHSADIIASASGGQMYVCGTQSGSPAKLSGPQPFYAASLFGANAVLLGLRKRKIAGKGCHIDLSIQEAVGSTLDHVMIDYFHDGKIAGRDAGIQDDSFVTLRCKDGHIQIPIFKNWETMVELMDSAGKAQDLLENKWRRNSYREKHCDHIVEVVEGWTGNHTKQELFELGQAMQFPWAPIELPHEVLRSPQLKARRFFARTQVPGSKTGIIVPRLPYKFSAFTPPILKPAPALGEHTRFVLESLGASGKKGGVLRRLKAGLNSSAGSGDILKGIRIIDLTRMLSGPYATRILGDFGAEVIKVQSHLTAKGAEWNDSPYFCAWNRNKQSVCLNLDHPEARDLFVKLISTSDVVVENYSPRVLKNWGLTYKRLKEAKPDLIMASISAMGQTGPWRDYVGFAPTFHALSGLIATSSPSPDTPVNIGHAYGDVVAGLYAALAILAALEYRDATGKGQYIDLSAYEAMCTLLGPAYNTHSRLFIDGGSAFCGCYPCAGNDRWCVIAIAGEDEWQTFCRLSGKPEWTSDNFSSMDKRRKNRRELDKLIVQWTTGQTAEDVERRLQKAGIAAAVVQNAEDLAHDSHLAARCFFVSLNHPKFGEIFSDRSALWPWREKQLHWKPAPQLGEANHCVFSDLLRHPDTEIGSFIKKGIIY